MLKTTTIEKLKGFGLNVDQLVAAIKAPGEVDFEVPEVTTYTAEQLTARDENVKKDAHRDGVAEGKNAGMEIASKTIAKSFNLDATLIDFKNPEKVAEAVKATAQKGDSGLQEQVTLLQKNIDQLTTEKDQLAKDFKQKAFETDLISSFPTNRSQVLNDSEYLLAIRANLQFEEHEGKMVVKKGGDILRDSKTQNPLAPKEAITSFFTERKWISEGTGNAGRGVGDKPGGQTGGIRTLKQAQETWDKEHPDKAGNYISGEFSNYVAIVSKDVPDFNYHEAS